MTDEKCFFIHFGLIVTGETEAEHLPKLFKDLAGLGVCSFEVIRRCSSLKPITSKKEDKKRQLRIVGTNYSITDEGEEALGLAARAYIQRSHCHFVLVVDDIEHDGRPLFQETFDRYRTTLDAFLKNEKHRASVHFLVNMLEAYYFAHADAVNLAIGTQLADHDGDVEAIRHPKQRLKELYPGFKEREQGGLILDQLNAKHILSNPNYCASLRTMFLWCISILERFYAHYDTLTIPSEFQSSTGNFNPITHIQISQSE